MHKWPQGEKHIYKERLFSFLRWLLEKKNVVIGVKNLEQLEDNLGSVGWKMSAADLKLLDDASSLIQALSLALWLPGSILTGKDKHQSKV